MWQRADLPKQPPCRLTKTTPRQGPRTQPPQVRRCLPARPTEEMRWENAFFDFVERANIAWNSHAYKECRDCCLAKRKAEKCTKRGGKKMNAAAHTFASHLSPGSLPPARITSAYLHTNATLCGQQSAAGDHPRLDVTFTFPTASGFVEMHTDGAVADSGARLCIYPINHLRAARVSLCKMKQTKLDLGAANTPS